MIKWGIALTREDKLQNELDLVEAKITLLKIALEESEREFDFIRVKQQIDDLFIEIDSVENYYDNREIVNKLLELVNFQHFIISYYESKGVA